MKRTIRKALLYLTAGFVILFFLRLGYGFIAPAGSPSSGLVSQGLGVTFSNFIGVESIKKNYATAKVSVAQARSQAYTIDQKYEKVATIHSRARSFSEDENKARGIAEKYEALIQYEHSAGLPGERRVELAIGVPPVHFDSMVSELKQVGDLLSILIDKQDKTDEYRELAAKRISLEKARDALISLKSKGGKIDEFTNLENRILEIEEAIQSTGVKLGDYDAENDLCTVRLALEEKRASQGISFLQRVRVALEWTVRYYLALIAILFLGSLFALITVVVLQRLNLIPPPLAKHAPATGEAGQ